MYEPLRINTKKIISIVAFSTMFIISFTLFMAGITSVPVVAALFIHAGILISILGLAWFFIKNFAWKISFIQKYRRILLLPPNVSGRYKGIIRRDGEKPYPFVIEIIQSLTSIIIHTYSRNSRTQSFIAEMATDKTGTKFYVCFFWQGLYGHYNCSRENNFQGYTLLHFMEDCTEKRMRGEFFSNKRKNGTGNVDLCWESIQLRGEL